MHLDRPVKPPYRITLEYAAPYFSEPNQWLYADGSIGLSGPLPEAKYGHYHDGIDYGVEVGHAVYAPGRGKVTAAGWDSTGFGVYLRIDHGGLESILGHLHTLHTTIGDLVINGDVVATSDTTGNANGPHLHWSVRDLKTSHYLPPARFVFDQTPTITRLSFKDVRYLAEQCGFHGDSKLTIAAISYAESRFNPKARYINTDGSIDRGILQINNRWHPEVSDSDADTPARAFGHAFKISKEGNDFTPWSTYNSGVYRAWLHAPPEMMGV